jgi:hypothetical protein
MRPQEIAQPKTQENTYQQVLNDSRYNLTDHRRLPILKTNQKTRAVRIIMTIWAKRIAKGSLKCSIELIKSVQESSRYL